MNIDRKWFFVSPLVSVPPKFRDEERREIRRALLLTALMMVVGLTLCLMAPGDEQTFGDGFEASATAAAP